MSLKATKKAPRPPKETDDGPSEEELRKDADEDDPEGEQGQEGGGDGDAGDDAGTGASPPKKKQTKAEMKAAAKKKNKAYKDRIKELEQLRGQVERLKRAAGEDPSPAAAALGDDPADPDVDKLVDDALNEDPEVKEIFERFGRTGSADELADTIAMFCMPLSLLHECWDMFDADGNPTPECKRLARGWLPILKKRDKTMLAWLKKYRAELLAASVTVSFLVPRFVPTYEAIKDPTKSRIFRIREEMAQAQAKAAAAKDAEAPARERTIPATRQEEKVT